MAGPMIALAIGERDPLIGMRVPRLEARRGGSGGPVSAPRMGAPRHAVPLVSRPVRISPRKAFA